MAEETTQPAEQAAATDPPKRKGGLMALAKPLAFVSVIVLLEVVAASVLLPSADATREIGEQLAAAEKADEEEAEEAADGGADADGADEDAAKLGETREVSLGAFHVVAYNPESRTSLNTHLGLRTFCAA